MNAKVLARVGRSFNRRGRQDSETQRRRGHKAQIKCPHPWFQQGGKGDVLTDYEPYKPLPLYGGGVWGGGLSGNSTVSGGSPVLVAPHPPAPGPPSVPPLNGGRNSHKEGRGVMGGDGVIDTDLEGRRGLLHGRFGVLIKIRIHYAVLRARCM